MFIKLIKHKYNYFIEKKSLNSILFYSIIDKNIEQN